METIYSGRMLTITICSTAKSIPEDIIVATKKSDVYIFEKSVIYTRFCRKWQLKTIHTPPGIYSDMYYSAVIFKDLVNFIDMRFTL